MSVKKNEQFQLEKHCVIAKQMSKKKEEDKYKIANFMHDYKK